MKDLNRALGNVKLARQEFQSAVQRKEPNSLRDELLNHWNLTMKEYAELARTAYATIDEVPNAK